MPVRKVNIHEAKTTLSRLVEAAERGEEILLARAGRPVARLVPLRAESRVRLGLGKGIVGRVSPAFDRPLSQRELRRLFGADTDP